MMKRYRTWYDGGSWSSVLWIDSFGEVANWQGERETGHKCLSQCLLLSVSINS